VANAVINLVGLPFEERPIFFMALLPRLQEQRARTGRPHWVVFDEAHHLVPASWNPASVTLPQEVSGVLFITVEPNAVARPVLDLVDTVIAAGEEPVATLQAFATAVDQKPPALTPVTLERGEVLVWARHTAAAPFRLSVVPCQTVRRRHRRKYAQGELGADESFYFRGPKGKLNLRAQNLILFLQLADGVDDATWSHHLRQGDYSRWFRTAIKDETLAAQAAAIETEPGLTPAESRARIKAAIEEHYTLPSASVPLASS
jgi:hypothetical protein